MQYSEVKISGFEKELRLEVLIELMKEAERLDDKEMIKRLCSEWEWIISCCHE